ncbi:MAG: hypothetical protein JNM22_01170 [Saprospiraceae bacterium]|nr:hypothetical protein [Saprospiraceae bacterium]
MRYALPAFLLFSLALHGQGFDAIDQHCLNTPNSRTRSVAKLAAHLAETATTDLGKLRAIYAWITLHIDYDDHYASSDFWATPEYLEEQSAEQVLHHRSGVCQGYANLFCALAREMGLPCEVVTGIVKESNGAVPELGHAWVAAAAEGEWRLFDPTWGVPTRGMNAFTVNDVYFAPPPERFVLNHLPDDPVWQLLEKPVTERVFRKGDDDEIGRYLSAAPDVAFAYADTLRQWLLMDAAQRMWHMELRILEFNDSNERAVFSLGQNYWGLFYDQFRLLDSLADDSILLDSIDLDTTWFLGQVGLLEKYHSRARDLLSRLESRERVAYAEKFYAPDDVSAIAHKLKGAMWSGQFEKALHRSADHNDKEALDEMRQLLLNADGEYALSERTLDCGKIYNTCLEIWHNRSLAYLQMAQREVTMLEQMLNDKDDRRLKTSISVYAPEIRLFFQRAAEDVHKMTLRPPVFAFTLERQRLIQSGLLTLRSCEIRAKRAAAMPRLEEMLRNTIFPFQKADAICQELAGIQTDMYQLMDSVENSGASLDADLMHNILFNLNYETYSLQYNLGTLQYKKAWTMWQKARQSNSLDAEKSNIQPVVDRVMEAVRHSNAALDAVEREGVLSSAHIAQRRQLVGRLEETARQLRLSLR